MHNTCVTIPGYGPRYKYTAKRLDCGNFYYAKQSCKVAKIETTRHRCKVSAYCVKIYFAREL